MLGGLILSIVLKGIFYLLFFFVGITGFTGKAIINKSVNTRLALFAMSAGTIPVVIFTALGVAGNRTMIAVAIVSAVIYAAILTAIAIFKNDGRPLKEKKRQLELYGADPAIDITFFEPEINKQNLIEATGILTNNLRTNTEFISDDMDIDAFLETLSNFGYIAYVNSVAAVNLVNNINLILKKLQFETQIKIEDILASDDEFTANRRRDGFDTFARDCNAISEILKRGHCELVGFPGAAGLYFAVVPTDKTDQLKLLEPSCD